MPNFSFGSFEAVADEIYDETNVRFSYIEIPDTVIHCSQYEIMDTFKSFFSTTHTLATASFLSPLAAVLSFKFVFNPSDTIICLVTGAMNTTKRR